MPSGEDAKRKKKNKSIRKKMRSESNKVSNRVAAIIAQKKRRLSGKRRMCQEYKLNYSKELIFPCNCGSVEARMQ
nr:DNA/RNA helicase, DEAD/DEAH box type, N-terminal [Tanacetum cinerariifolium]